MYKILVIDDDRMVRHITKVTLRELQCEVLEAQDGEQGLEMVKDHDIDLIFLDIMMPKINGWIFTEKYRMSRISSLVPIVFMTTISSIHTRANIFRNGADDFIRKPLSVAELTFRLHKTMRYKKNMSNNTTSISCEQNVTIGTLDEIGLAFVLMALEKQQRTGILKLTNHHHCARIVVVDGQIMTMDVDEIAIAQISEIYRLLTWTTGEYHFESTEPPNNINEKKISVSSILIDCGNYVDEINEN